MTDTVNYRDAYHIMKGRLQATEALLVQEKAACEVLEKAHRCTKQTVINRFGHLDDADMVLEEMDQNMKKYLDVRAATNKINFGGR